MLKFLLERRREAARRSQRLAEETAAFYGVDLNKSGAARMGARLIKLSIFLQVATPVLAAGGVMALSAASTFAQSPGGPIFGQSDQTTGRGIVEFIKWFRNLIFVAGVFFFGWAALNMGFERPWGTKAIAGVACWAFAAVAALAYSFSQGNAVQFDTDLGN